MEITYKNPWYNKNNLHSKETYTSKVMENYKGHQICKVTSEEFHAVKDNTCCLMAGSINFIKNTIDDNKYNFLRELI